MSTATDNVKGQGTMEIETRIRLVVDTDPESPRKWDNAGVMYCWHTRYNLGDEQPKETAAEWTRDLACSLAPGLADAFENWEHNGRKGYTDAEIDNAIADSIYGVLAARAVMLPLYLYDHSGLTMNTGGFSCPWDSGQVGWIVCTLEAARKEWGKPGDKWNTVCGEKTLRQWAEGCLKGEVATYDTFLRGDVYGFIIETRTLCPTCGEGEWDRSDSCWGFYGSDPDENGMMDGIPEDLRDALRKAEVEYR